MTAAGQPYPIPAIPPLPEGAGPRAIRAALLAEEREEFDQAYRRALAEAADTLELAGVLEVLEHWRRRAIISADPQAYRRMLRRAAELLSGDEVPEDEPLAQLKERLDRLGV
jgi:flavin-binding protein dodecin